MGGTSTDVSLIVDGEVERAFETEVGGVRVKAPMLRIHTVAAGGGSLCSFDGQCLTVGPGSAGAHPGPLCYGLRDERGERLARQLALTDANVVLGRVPPDHFPFEMDRAAAGAELQRLAVELGRAGFEREPDGLAAGFLEVANAHMAGAIAEVSIARGVDPREGALVAFGGAAGQHACAVARSLGMRHVLLPPLGGLLSAWGIGHAPLVWDGECDAGRVLLPEGALPEQVADDFVQLEARGRAVLRQEGCTDSRVQVVYALDLRYRGTEAPLAIELPRAAREGCAWRRAFEAEHRRRFGYLRPQREVEVVTARVRLRDDRPALSRAQDAPRSSSSAGPSAAAAPQAAQLRRDRVWFAPDGWCDAPVFARESLVPGTHFEGPALVIEQTGTFVVEPGFAVRIAEDGVMHAEDVGGQTSEGGGPPGRPTLEEADPVRLEVFGSRFMSIAEQMGAVLRNTSVSTNIKERLDYSCALFDASGGLVANAPHIPVHLGAMGATVRSVLRRFPDLVDGDVIATNDSFEGGSHLPDVTVVTPVFLAHGAERPDFFVASRGHHADIGGRTPGSMPSDSKRLEEEGVVLEAFRVVHAGHFDEQGLRARLLAGPWPARRPEDNRADLEAMIAANRAGAGLLRAFVEEQGRRAVAVTMAQLQRAAAARVAQEIARFPDGVHRFEDRLDDGTPLCATLEVSGDRMRIDFTGTGPAVAGNLNAPRAVVEAAVLYVLRSLVDGRIPLNGGCLDPVDVVIPTGSLLDPPRGAAVVGGNVETSQRIVDVLLGALGVVAASQGTMNNVTFGTADFGYYETIGGGAGAGPGWDGASGVHSHMTNTRITDVEVIESRYPVRIDTFAIRNASGEAGAHRGGDGLLRRYVFSAPVTVSLLCERRTTRPYGLDGGEPGAPGCDRVERATGAVEALAGHCEVALEAGDCLRIETPGGGGYGRAGTARRSCQRKASG